MPIKPEHFDMLAKEIDKDLSSDKPNIDASGQFIRSKEAPKKPDEDEKKSKDLPVHLL